MIKKIDYFEDFLFYLFAFFCCFPQKISSTFLILFGVVFLFNSVIKFYISREFVWNVSKRLMPAFILLFISLLSFITIFYADNVELILKRVFEQRLILLLLPIVALLRKRKFDFLAFLKVYIWGNFFFVVYSCMYVGYQYWVADNVMLHRDFIDNFTHVCCLLQHRTYVCLNLVISYAALFYLLTKNYVSKRFSIVYFVITFLFFILNNSRAEDIALLVVLGTILFYTFKRSKIKTLCVVIIIVLLGFVSIKVFPESRLSKQVEKIVEQKNIRALDDPRIYIWESAISLAKDHILCGLGVNNYEKPLTQRYEQFDFMQGYISNYNTHNQFLGFQLEFGIVGVVLLLVLLLSFPLYSERNKRLFYYQLSGILFVSLFFENMLDRYAGCATLALFVLVFSWEDYSKNKLANVIGDKICYLFSFVLILLLLITTYKDKSNEYGYFFNKNLFSRLSEGEKVYDFVEEAETPFIDKLDIVAFREFAVLNVLPEQKVFFEIQCKVDTSYTGQFVGVSFEDKLRNPKGLDLYDLNRKGEWQTLQLQIPSGRSCVVLFSRTSEFNRNPIQFRNPQVRNEDNN